MKSNIYCHVKWVPCHHGMARPQVADGGESLQIWRVAANILNKKSRTADKGWPSSLGVGRGLATPHRKKINTLRNVTKGLGIGWMLWNDLRYGKWTCDLERGMLGVSIGQGL
jgi:hypothetical protein